MPAIKHTSKTYHQTTAPTGPHFLEVTFALDRAGAGEVLLCGDFSNWCPRPMRMIQQARNDRWEKRLVLPAGRYEYKFIVDGRWTTDPLSTEDRPNTMGSMNSILRVMP